jgi:hypothetical protein
MLEGIVMHERIKGILKGKNEETEMKTKGAVGFLECVLVWKESEKRGGNTVPQFV